MDSRPRRRRSSTDGVADGPYRHDRSLVRALPAHFAGTGYCGPRKGETSATLERRRSFPNPESCRGSVRTAAPAALPEASREVVRSRHLANDRQNSVPRHSSVENIFQVPRPGQLERDLVAGIVDILQRGALPERSHVVRPSQRRSRLRREDCRRYRGSPSRRCR